MSSAKYLMTKPKLARYPLGSSGTLVTPLGLGGAWLGRTPECIDEELAIATVLRALDLGINLIDTSAGYLGGSRSERIIGEALERWYELGGRRGDVVISTKTGTRDRQNRDFSASGTRQSVEESLELLRTDYLDVVLVHDPRELDPVLAPDGAWAELKRMKAEGLIRMIGLGVRTHEFHRRLIETGECDVVLTHSDFHLLDQSAGKDVLDPAAARGVGVFLGSPLGQGLLSGRDPREVLKERPRLAAHSPDFEARVEKAYELWTWCKAWGVDLLALNLQFCVRDPRVDVTLVGAATPGQIERDVQALSAEIPAAMWEELPAKIR
ncbi:MAG: aldo/keto reductase [Anaerolineae bacterium]